MIKYSFRLGQTALPAPTPATMTFFSLLSFSSLHNFPGEFLPLPIPQSQQNQLAGPKAAMWFAGCRRLGANPDLVTLTE